MARILVVDDDPDFVEIMRLVLTARGYDVETASSGDLALRSARAHPPDLVLLDVMMTGILDGVHVAHTLSEDSALGHPPVIMISSITDSPMAGFFPTDEYLPIDAWLSKPVQPDELLRRVSAVLEGRRRTAAPQRAAVDGGDEDWS
ncbi:MAG: response regulator [Chloroflexi bacterium]|nr:response regulator [Chloroflexota bacterium]